MFKYSKEKKTNAESVRMNLKGQRVETTEGPNINISTLENELFKKSSGPNMLNMKTRFKIWGAMFCVGLYFYLTYRLIIYRLKSDDLDLMEREVNEEFRIKKKLNEL